MTKTGMNAAGVTKGPNKMGGVRADVFVGEVGACKIGGLIVDILVGEEDKEPIKWGGLSIDVLVREEG